MKKIVLLSLMALFSFAFSAYGQSEDQSTLKKFWNAFKSAVQNEDFEKLASLSDLPLVDLYIFSKAFETNDAELYFKAKKYNEINWKNFKKAVKGTSFPQKYKFYSESSKKDLYKRYKLEYGTEIYYVGIEGWYWSYADLLIANIDGYYYIIGDESMEYN